MKTQQSRLAKVYVLPGPVLGGEADMANSRATSAQPNALTKKSVDVDV